MKSLNALKLKDIIDRQTQAMIGEGYGSDSSDLAVELVKLDMETKAAAKFKAAQEKAAADMVRLEKVRIEREATAIKQAQEAAAAEAYTWMKVFQALTDRGLDANKAMDAIKKMQDAGHTAEMCLEMIEKTEVKFPPVQPKEPEPKPPRPESFGSWA